MPTLAVRRILRRLRRDAIVKESMDDVADQFVARSLRGNPNADIEGIVEAIDQRQLRLEGLYYSLARYNLIILLVLFISTLPAAQQAAEVSFLGLSLKQDAILKFRVLLLFASGICGIISALTLYSQRSLAAVQRALLRSIYPSDAFKLACHKYSMDGGVPYVGDLLFFEKERIYNRLRPVMSIIFVAISFAIVFILLLGAGLYIQFQILADLYYRPSGPAWFTYCAIIIVVLTDLSLLYFFVDTHRKRRVVYYSNFQTRFDQWIDDSRTATQVRVKATLKKLANNPKKLEQYRKKLTDAGIDPDNP